jgi:transcriptional regulator with XRE-family HTH domain
VEAAIMAHPPFRVRLREARRRKKLTQAQIAAALKVSQSAIAQWESGRSVPSADRGTKIEQLLGVPFAVAEPDELYSIRAPLRTRTSLPVIGLPAPGDSERILIDNKPHGEVLAPPQLEGIAGARAVYVRGSRMEPRYYPGEIVYLHPARPANPGDFVFVTVREPGFATAVGYIRQFIGQDLTHIRTLTLNPKREHLIAKESLLSMATIVGSGLL